MNSQDLPDSVAPDNWRAEPYLSALLPAPLAETASYESVLMPATMPIELPVAPSAEPPAQASEATRFNLYLFAITLLAGCAGAWLLQLEQWGLGALLWLGLVLALWNGVRRYAAAPWPPFNAALSCASLWFAGCLAWRASPVLQALDLGALAVLALWQVWRTERGQVWRMELTEAWAVTWRTFKGCSTGAWRLVRQDIVWAELPRSGWSGRSAAVGRGLLLALPLLLVFGALLRAADAAFEALLAQLFNFQPLNLFLHLFTITGWSWLVGGYLRTATQPAAPALSVTAAPPWRLGVVELSVVLGLLNLLFFAFVVVQFQYLFFGALAFKPGAGAAYANYARRGFFELVTVAALVLPLLLGAHALLDKAAPRNERIFRWLASGQIALLFVMMASAVYRMRLYQLTWGLTELRVYTMAFMGWLALVFGWFGLTVLRQRRAYFASGALAAGLVLVAGLHFLNPDALIVRTNLERARAGQPFDAYYNATLSADAVPALITGLSQANSTDQTTLRLNLLRRQPEFVPQGWRTWNWARQRAWQSLSTQP